VLLEKFNMSDYHQEGGRFLQALEQLPQQYKLPFVSIEGDYFRQVRNGHSMEDWEAAPDAIGQVRQKRNKVKHGCPDCQADVWGKPQLKILCGECNRELKLAGHHDIMCNHAMQQPSFTLYNSHPA
jgi:hypothetical protein